MRLLHTCMCMLANVPVQEYKKLCSKMEELGKKRDTLNEKVMALAQVSCGPGPHACSRCLWCA